MQPFNTTTLFPTHRLTHLSMFIAGILFACLPVRAMEEQPPLDNQIIPLIIETQEAKTRTCGLCKKTFSTVGNLNVHKKIHSGEKLFPCNECGKKFSTADNLVVHKRTHTGERPYPCDHPGCGKAFTIATNLAVHEKTHTGERPYPCDECGKKFTRADKLAVHIRTHTGEKPYSCKFHGCKSAFADARNLAVHERTHKGEKPYICPVCGKTSTQKSNLNRHIKTHTGEEPFQFPECEREFRQPCHLTAHKGLPAKRPFIQEDNAEETKHPHLEENDNVEKSSENKMLRELQQEVLPATESTPIQQQYNPVDMLFFEEQTFKPINKNDLPGGSLEDLYPEVDL